MLLLHLKGYGHDVSVYLCTPVTTSGIEASFTVS